MAVLLLAWPLIAPQYWVYIFAQVFVFGIAAIGLCVLTGYGGVLSLAQGAFMAVGGYGVIILANRFHTPWEIAVVVAAAVAGMLGFGLATVGLRLSGLTLALATFGLQIFTQQFLGASTDLTGGLSGIVSPPLVLLGHFPITTDIHFYYLDLAVGIVIFVLAQNLVNGRVGKRLIAVRANPYAAALGISRHRTLSVSFALAAIAASIAGSLDTAQLGYIGPDTFDTNASVLVLAMVVVGGPKSVVGSVIGAFSLIILSEGLNLTGATSTVLFGAVIVVMMLSARDGVAAAGVAFGRRVWTLRRPAAEGHELSGTTRDLVAGAFGIAQARGASGAPAIGPILTAEALILAFGGVIALDNLDLAIPQGATASIIGANGAGKTSLLNVISRFYTPARVGCWLTSRTCSLSDRTRCRGSALPALSRLPLCTRISPSSKT